jgi:hypothetical protein
LLGDCHSMLKDNLQGPRVTGFPAAGV